MFVLSELLVSHSYVFDLPEDMINAQQTRAQVKYLVTPILSTAHVYNYHTVVLNVFLS